MPGYNRNRVAEDIRREITVTIKDVKDPRVQDKLLTVVRVTVSKDLSSAKVYISDLKGIESAKEATDAFNSAAGYIRREVAQKLRLRKAPELQFIADDSVEQGVEMFKKLSG
ncbi:MAG: 30S ribosome-binding factor RbfA [Ruminococcaceae bacterium]|nr:30S ribosome-binding factor RbfA [Oscillospiraceae bacterium]